MIKKIIGWAFIVLTYVGICWVFPYIALNDKSQMLVLELQLHGVSVFCFVGGHLLAWAFP
jgi:hypothetical protein